MFDDLIELGLAEDPMLDELDREDVAELYVRAAEMRDIAQNAVRKLSEHIGRRFDTPQILSNGWVVKPDVSVSRTGWRNAELWERFYEVAAQTYVDVNGEKVDAVPKRAVETLLDLGKGKTRAWREFGVRLDDYCTKTETPTVKVIR